jgi:hypothetical protein
MNLSAHKVILSATVTKNTIKVKMAGQTDNIVISFHLTKEEADNLIELLGDLRDRLRT